MVALPADDLYYRSVLRNQRHPWPPSLAQRLLIASQDPAFPWGIASTRARAERPLPDLPLDPVLHRAYGFLMDPDNGDEAMRLATQLQRVEHWLERDLIRALDLCFETSDQAIAELCAYDTDVIRLHRALWWNVRERFNDKLFMAHLLNARTAGVENEPSRGCRLLRVASLTGSRALVLVEADLGRLSDFAAGDMAGQLKDLLQAVAAGGDQEAIELLEQYIKERVQAEDARAFLLELSRDPHAQKVLKGIVERNALDIIQEGDQNHTSATNKPAAVIPGPASEPTDSPIT